MSPPHKATVNPEELAVKTNQQSPFETLQRFYKEESAYLEAPENGFAGIAATLDPECVIYQPASLPYGGEWKGHSGFEEWMKAFSQQWDSLEVTSPDLYPHGDVIVSRSHVYAIAKSSGRKVDWPLLQFFRICDGKILELRPFYWDTAALLSALNDPSS